MSFFSKPRFSAASVAITLSFFAQFGSIFVLTQHLQFVLGYSALESGLKITPFATLVVAAPISARIVERIRQVEGHRRNACSRPEFSGREHVLGRALLDLKGQ